MLECISSREIQARSIVLLGQQLVPICCFCWEVGRSFLQRSKVAELDSPSSPNSKSSASGWEVVTAAGCQQIFFLGALQIGAENVLLVSAMHVEICLTLLFPHIGREGSSWAPYSPWVGRVNGLSCLRLVSKDRSTHLLMLINRSFPNLPALLRVFLIHGILEDGLLFQDSPRVLHCWP